MTPAWSPPDIERRYNDALNSLPHIHCRYQQRFVSDPYLTPPEDCAFCGYFAEPLYNDFGLWFMTVHPPGERYSADRLAASRMLLETAQSVAPWSPHAYKNLEALDRLPGQRLHI
jgi:hypothetical protein